MNKLRVNLAQVEMNAGRIDAASAELLKVVEGERKVRVARRSGEVIDR